VRYFLPADEIFDVIQSAHIAIRHGGRDRLKKEVSRKYANVTTEMINIFLSMCETCPPPPKKVRTGKAWFVNQFSNQKRTTAAR
jgi:hypothetical protein